MHKKYLKILIDYAHDLYSPTLDITQAWFARESGWGESLVSSYCVSSTTTELNPKDHAEVYAILKLTQKDIILCYQQYLKQFKIKRVK